jgi:pilus assembly protein CpaE
MYPLNVVLVGIGENLLPHVRRELANHSANLECEYRTVPGALDGLRACKADMRLFIHHVRQPEDVEELRRLNGGFVGRPILALVEAGKETRTLLAANRAGASQIVPLPFQSDDFRDALNCLGLQFGYPATEKRVIAVSGTTGGCGATTLAINLAYEIAFRHNLHCILGELALQMGVLATYLDREPKITIHDLLSSSSRLDVYMVQQALINVAQNFDILAGPHMAIAPLSVSAAEVIHLVDLAKALADVVVLDVPCTYNDLYFEILVSADHVVLVGEQKVPSIRALKLVRDTLGSEHATMQRVVINRYDGRVEGFTTDDLEKLLGARGQTVANDYVSVNAAVNHGRPLRLEAPQSAVLNGIDALVDSVLGVADHKGCAPGASGGFFGRLAHAFRAK